MNRYSTPTSDAGGHRGREVVATRPVAVRYSITPLGKTFREPVDALLAWTAHMADV